MPAKLRRYGTRKVRLPSEAKPGLKATANSARPKKVDLTPPWAAALARVKRHISTESRNCGPQD